MERARAWGRRRRDVVWAIVADRSEEPMKTASWVLVTAVAALTLLASLVSFGVAYGGARDEFGVGGPTLSDVASWNPGVATAGRAPAPAAPPPPTRPPLLFSFFPLPP